MIPKIIHYCWFGKKRKPKLVRDCITSWRKYLPDYQIIEWNETNTDLFHPFVKEAYNCKKWAFVSDYVRLEKLVEFGGVYLDTDMMLLKSLDVFLENECFFGAEDYEFISCGIIGAVADNQFIKNCKGEYDFLQLGKDTSLGAITIPRIVTQKFKSIFNFDNDFNTVITKSKVRVYPPNYFYPFPLKYRSDLTNYKNYVKEISHAVHLWSSSWIEYSEFHYFRNGAYQKGFSKMFHHIYTNKETKFAYFKKIASSIKESLNK